jgi:hypothetical protein
MSLKSKIENANKLGRENLTKKYVKVEDSETTHEIMKHIEEIEQNVYLPENPTPEEPTPEEPFIPPVFEYKNVIYNSDNTISFIDKDDLEHTMKCTYENGKMIEIDFDGGNIELLYDGDELVGIGDTIIDLRGDK